MPGIIGCEPDETGPITSLTDQITAGLDIGNNRRCPGGNERPLAPVADDDSVPFTDGGALTDGEPGECDPTQVLPGP